MAEEHWQQARLIPTSGIAGTEEAERRATSALLAVLGSVSEFGQAVLKPLGAPAGKVGTFIEVPFKVNEMTCYPDGLVEVTRGSRSWTTLIEVKTGSSELERPQIETYLDVARENRFDSVVTISNQIAPAPGVHPVDVDRRKLKKVTLHHLSWAEILSIAVQQRVHRGVSDPDQAWILGELIRYLEHPRSGALDFTDMSASWVPAREAVVAGTLRANDKCLPEVVSRWEQLLRFAALRLGRELGRDVQVVLSRKENADPSIRFTAQAQSLVATGAFTGSLRVPDAAGDLDVVADLRAQTISVSLDLDAPRDGRPATRVSWLVRQLRDAPDGLRIDAFFLNARTSTSELLRTVREDPAVLIDPGKREFRSFRVAATSPMGAKRGTGRGAFIDSLLAAIDGFYEAVAQQLVPWTPKAPKLPTGGRTAAEASGLDLELPPLDEVDPIDGTESAPAADPVDVQAGVEEGQDLPPGQAAQPSGTVDTTPALPSELVQWDGAQDRLEHERGIAAGDPSDEPESPLDRSTPST
jgi:hypothetical protein